MKIIILKRDKLGDLLLTTPMLQLLKQYFPSSTLSVIAPQSSAWILKDAPFIDELYIYPQPKSFNLKSLIALLKQLTLFLKIREQHFDINGDIVDIECNQSTQDQVKPGSRDNSGHSCQCIV